MGFCQKAFIKAFFIKGFSLRAVDGASSNGWSTTATIF
jgi:hypothetical protein